MESLKSQLKKNIEKVSFQEKYNALIQQTLENEEVKAFIQLHHVPEDVVTRSHAKLFEFVKEKEQLKKGHATQNAGFEPVLSLSTHFIDVVYRPTKEYLLQQEKAAVLNRITTLDMPKNIKQLTLEQVELTDNRYDILNYMTDFVKQYHTPQLIKGAYIYGSYGVGKTHLLGALAGTLAKKGYSSYLVHFPSLVVELKAAIGDNQVNDKLSVLKKTPILMIDDIGGENMTPWVRDDILMTLLDYRMREQLPTFFTSNLSFDVLVNHLKGTTVEDERKAMRVMERIKALSMPFQLKGANRRQ